MRQSNRQTDLEDGYYQMAELVIRLPDSTLEHAQRLADERGTSVDQLVQAFLESIDDPIDRYRQAGERLLARTYVTNASSGPEGRTWTREDLHDRVNRSS